MTEQSWDSLGSKERSLLASFTQKQAKMCLGVVYFYAMVEMIEKLYS